MKTEIAIADRQKYAYHEGARHIRAVLDRVCELAYLEQSPTDEDRDSLCDRLIELHQILYEVTLFTARADSVGDEEYAQDETYSDGQSVVSRVLLSCAAEGALVPPHEYHGDIGEDVPSGVLHHVWRPGEVVVSDSGETNDLSGPEYWKPCADLRAQRLLAWVRDEQNRIVKRPGHSGRLQAVCRITEAGVAECEQINREMAADDGRRAGVEDGSQG